MLIPGARRKLVALGFLGAGLASVAACTGREEPAVEDVGQEDVILFERAATALPPWHEDNRQRRHAGEDDWRGEVLNDLAEQALGGLLHALAAAGDDAGEDLPLDVDFAGASALRPEVLDTVFDDGATRVLRGRSERTRHPSERLPALWRELVAPYAEPPQTHFKIVGVEELEDGGFETTLLLHSHGHGADGIVQQNARWRVAWSVTSDGELARIRELDVLDLEEVHTRGPLLADLTGHVFGGLPRFRDELLRGVPEYHFRTDFLLGNTLVGMQGVALGDVDGDGQDDVYLPQQGGLPNRLFLRRTDGTVEDASERSELDFLDATRSALIVDLDDDGDQDMAISLGPVLVLAFNDGSGRFPELRSRRAPGAEELYSLCAADADGDGDLDIYGCRYSSRDSLSGVPVPYHDANNGAANVYWRNEGERHFVNATVEAGLDVNNRRFSYAAIWEDFDLDGDPDLYVANDFGRNNLYRNEGGTFTDVAAEAGAEDKSSGMGVSVADYDLDGDMDLYVTNMFSSAGSRIVPQYRFREERAEMLDDHLLFARGNTLLANRGDGTFEDVTATARVAVGGWAWGAMFVDLNNDGLEDTYSPNGYITNDDPDDT